MLSGNTDCGWVDRRDGHSPDRDDDELLAEMGCEVVEVERNHCAKSKWNEFPFSFQEDLLDSS